MTSQELVKSCLHSRYRYQLIKGGDNEPYVYLHDTTWLDAEQAIKLNTDILENAPVDCVLEIIAEDMAFGGYETTETIGCYRKDINQNWELF